MATNATTLAWYGYPDSYTCGIFLATPVAAFTAETIALDDALSYLHNALFQSHEHKRSRTN